MAITKFQGIPQYDPGDKEKFTIVKEEIGDKVVDVIYRKGVPGVTKEEMSGDVTRSYNFNQKLKFRTYEAAEGIICVQDQVVELRDGKKIYVDLFLPSDQKGPFPLIISWGPFGKRQSEGTGEWKLMGVAPGTVSTLSKFESADPSYWCRKGYAMANCDPRGVGNSEGFVSNFGPQDSRDGYDFIEWAATQPWCNGKISLFGNSGVAMVIWRIAAEQPPHLTCIAVWEGTGDLYRETMCSGGIPTPKFNEGILAGIACNEYIEDLPNMLSTHPYMDEFWESRIPKWENIKIPAYVAAGWCHFHLRGSIEGFRRIRSPKKWLRTHREFEWPDTYSPQNLDDLCKFYDRYLKDIRNGWEFTPRVRIEVQDAYDFDYRTNRPEKAFPIPRTEYRKLYLDAASSTACYEPYAAEATAVYTPDQEGKAVFDFKVQEETEITGYMKLHLNVECRGHDNMSLFVWVKKLGQDGEYLPIISMGQPYRGAWGYCNCQRRELDPKLSTDFNPVQAHLRDEPLEEGKVYPVDIEIWPHSRVWHKGETIRVEITGSFIRTEWAMDNTMAFETDNGDGKHVIHTGGKYDSYLQIPFIPPIYKSGDYELR